MAVDPLGSAGESGTTVITSAALALSQQARQAVSEQVDKIAQASKEADKASQRREPVDEVKDSSKTESEPHDFTGSSSSGQTVPQRGQNINIEG
ncbi:MAG: hypothetical protein RIB59_09805 [Rhodospirillales bacterium]